MQLDQEALEATLIDFVNKILGEQGLITQHAGMLHNPKQLEYALSTAKGLARQDRQNARTSINALQAATGTGKTIGYLVPAMLYAALTGERVVISTYTRHLQKQVLADANTVSEWVRELTSACLKTRLRVGASNFASPARIELLQAALLREGNNDGAVAFLDDLLDWATETNPDDDTLINSGLINDYLQDTGLDALPFGILPSWVGVKADSPDADRMGYIAHTKAAAEADILVLNHALLIASALRWGGALVNESHPLGAVICDEADRLRDAAESMTQADVTFAHAKVNARLIASKLDQPALDLASSKMADAIQALRSPSDRVMVLDRDQPSTECVMKAIQEYVAVANPIASQLSKIMRVDSLFKLAIPEDVASDFIGYTDRLSEIIRLSKDGEALAMLSWSPVRAFPSIRMGKAQPGRVLGRLWAKLQDEEGVTPPAVIVPSILFTSATLGSPGRGLPMAFDEFFQDIGVIRHAKKGESLPIHYVHTDLFGIFEPTRFGNLSFVVMSPAVCDPTSNDNGIVETSPEWLDACSEMIAAAAGAGGRTLVLTTSYSDGEGIKKILESHGFGDRVVLHRKGRALSEMISRFKVDEKCILITPAAWEGVNLPGLISQLVVTRIPYVSTDSTELMLRKLGYIKTGINEGKASSLIVGRMQADARRKLSQGIGRPIRRAEDSAQVWFADPRMPMPACMADSIHPVVLSAPSRKQNLSLLAAIPARFRQTRYDKAPVFLPNGWSTTPTLVSMS